jgi:predicted nucleic acid-binding protein
MPIDGRKARAIVEDLCAWEVVTNDEQAVLAAIDLKIKHHLSFWDSLIIEAARRVGATRLYSEDLSNGQQIGGMTIVDPFEE